MVDPVNFTNYNLTNAQLEEYVMFGIAAAGKPGAVTARCLDLFLRGLHAELGFESWRPLDAVSRFTHAELVPRLKAAGLGCYNQRARGFLALAAARLDLRRCSAEDLERIPGIKFKTSRLFILHTRRGARVACLDTHILKFLRELGHEAPRQTPQGRRQYLALERAFLDACRERRIGPARFDLMLWRKYSGNAA